jgi:hypothetical protein
MVLLRSVDRFQDLAELDTDTGQISWFSRPRNCGESLRIQGSIARLHNRVLCLYREEEMLHFRVDNKDIELTEETTIHLVSIDENYNRIIVFCDDVSLLDWAYQRPEIEPSLDCDLTPFVEEEQFDFCLFVYNVANDKSRRENIYAHV